MNYRKTLLAASIITSLCMSAAAFAADVAIRGTVPRAHRRVMYRDASYFSL